MVEFLGQGVQIGDEEIAGVFAGILEFHEVPERAQIITQMAMSFGFYAGNEDWLWHSG